jgi:hypothetical protein
MDRSVDFSGYFNFRLKSSNWNIFESGVKHLTSNGQIMEPTTTAQVQLRWMVIVLLILMEFMIITIYKLSFDINQWKELVCWKYVFCWGSLDGICMYFNFRLKSSNWNIFESGVKHLTSNGQIMEQTFVYVMHNIKHLWVIMWHIFKSTNNITTI